jgi:hypothetical protein
MFISVSNCASVVSAKLGPCCQTPGRVAVGQLLAGLGLIQAPLGGMRPLIEQGLLVEVLPDFKGERIHDGAASRCAAREFLALYSPYSH